jgi:hypothetical protein
MWPVILCFVLLAIFAIVFICCTCAKCEKDVIISQAKSQVRTSQDVMLLKNYNQEGGFFWQMYNVLNMLYVCEQRGFLPVVIFDTGLYFEKRPEFTATIPTYDPENWFNHFFQPINKSNKPQHYWLDYAQKNKLQPYENNTDKKPVMLFNRATLKTIHPDKNRTKSFTHLWHKYIKVQPHILKLVDDFKKNHAFPSKTVIGLHFRGTDKFASKTGSEDKPLHYEYGFCEKLLMDHIQRHSLTKDTAVVFIATDEEPFIEFMQTKANLNGVPVCRTNSIRSGVSTSGLFMDTTKCQKGISDSAVCTKYNKLITDSVHRGFPDESKYKKGEDVLVDVLLLSCSNVFFRSRGNVSNFIGYINPKCKIIDMVTEYEKQIL